MTSRTITIGKTSIPLCQIVFNGSHLRLFCTDGVSTLKENTVSRHVSNRISKNNSKSVKIFNSQITNSADSLKAGVNANSSTCIKFGTKTSYEAGRAAFETSSLATKSKFSSSGDYRPAQDRSTLNNSKHRDHSLAEYPESTIDSTPTDTRLLHTLMLCRHGTRYPSSRDIRNVRSSLLRNFCNNHDYSKLWNVLSELSSEPQHKLSSKGYQELFRIGWREGVQWRNQMSVGVGINSDQYFRFISSSSKRAVDSCRAFRHGLIYSIFSGESNLKSEDADKILNSIIRGSTDRNNNEGNRIASLLLQGDSKTCVSKRSASDSNIAVLKEKFFERQNLAGQNDPGLSHPYELQYNLGNADHDGQHIIIRDDLMRFFDKNEHYLKTVTNNLPAALEEYLDWTNRILKEVSEAIKDGLNLYHINLSAEEMMSFYSIAGIELALLGTNHFSQLLNEDVIKLLEYAADLKVYWKLGYGRAINYEQSAPLMADWLLNMQTAVELDRADGLPKKGVYYFGHAETLVPLLCLLGLAKDSNPLRHHNYREREDIHRQFRVSQLSPFAANISLKIFERTSSIPSHRMAITSSEGRQSSIIQDLYDMKRHHDSNENKGRQFVRLYVNETPVWFPNTRQESCCYQVAKRHCSDAVFKSIK